MHGIVFIQDLATVMLVAGLTTVIFQRLRQPVVLGYIIAGLLIGPHTLPVIFIHDEETIRTLSELGMILLLFALGLEFSLKKLRAVGGAALVAAFAEIVLMVWIGYEIGRFFGWSAMDAIFLGAMLSISSTTIIMKALEDLGLKRERFAQLMFGILIVEDLLAIVLMALLTGIASTGGLEASQAFAAIGRLGLFMAVSLVVGLLLVPRVVDYIARVSRNDVLLIAVLGICFGFCLLVTEMGYSVALGAFMIGAIVAESDSVARIERIIMPVRDMFSAIFFVAIGMLIDPALLVEYAWPITIVTIAVVVGKVVTCSFGSFVAGNDGRTSLRVGMGLAQIGEFSFVIASLGLTLEVTSKFLYPVAVAVSAITTFLTPYLIRASDPLASFLGRALPTRVTGVFGAYTEWMGNLGLQGQGAIVMKMIRRLVWHVIINMMLVIAVFVIVAFAYRRGFLHVDVLSDDATVRRSLAWSFAALMSLPMVVAAYRKAGALGMLLAELSIPDRFGSRTFRIRSVLGRIIPVVAMLILGLLVAALASTILPPREVAGVLVLIGIGLVWLLWRVLVQVHARLQAALRDTLEKPGSGHDE
ncbi:cation/H(+) antiporter [Luteibacter rhizovicinus DSM 16549]|uniref:Cation/H(+) antiporter n=1 Tax=Luteibacter rhizovicinus DSM 16549 TaxID=1440763 RepID=A0A0G9HJL7_9GAMM|nr:cation:proton antiporter [Luteibacter rhizovicinus]APG05268.1 cation/H(+) antiporter [Luteibacter rhizovicinus DSM 16549]KLD67887.1 potassium transporter [Luteibacter rhizovicinus DSM 16549]KLD74823.1 potassium transporter [Xanthomonas hyacinthi DSM 19077]